MKRKELSLVVGLLLSSSLLSLGSIAEENEKDKVQQLKEEIANMSPADSAKKIIELNDKDEDGKLSPKEVNTSFKLKRFKQVDTDGDGFLSESELEVSYANAKAAAEQKNQNKERPSSPSLFQKIKKDLKEKESN